MKKETLLQRFIRWIRGIPPHQYYYTTVTTRTISDEVNDFKYGIYIMLTSNVYTKDIVEVQWFDSIEKRNSFIKNAQLLPIVYNCGCKGVELLAAEITNDSLSSSKHWMICKTCLKDKLDNGAIAVL